MERKPTDIVQLKLRIREDLRQQLEADARARRISMNAAIAERLEWAFLLDEVSLGRLDIMLLTSLITAITRAVETRTGNKWNEDQATFRQIRRTITRALEQAPGFAAKGFSSLPRSLHQALLDLAVAQTSDEREQLSAERPPTPPKMRGKGDQR